MKIFQKLKNWRKKQKLKKEIDDLSFSMASIEMCAPEEFTFDAEQWYNEAHVKITNLRRELNELEYE